jgi:hypothetical protein
VPPLAPRLGKARSECPVPHPISRTGPPGAAAGGVDSSPAIGRPGLCIRNWIVPAISPAFHRGVPSLQRGPLGVHGHLWSRIRQTRMVGTGSAGKWDGVRPNSAVPTSGGQPERPRDPADPVAKV